MIGLSSSSWRVTPRRLIMGSWTSPSSRTSPPGRSDIAFTSPPTLKKSPAPVSTNGIDCVIIGKVVPDRPQLPDQLLIDRIARLRRFRVTVATLSATSTVKHSYLA